MPWIKNKQDDIVQSNEKVNRRVTGLWAFKIMVRGKERLALKGHFMNQRAFENMQAYGTNTVFWVKPNKRKRGANPPDYILFAAPGDPTKKTRY